MKSSIGNDNEIKNPVKNRQLAIAFLWGLAEASVFFIVPDVWLTFIARHKMDRTKYQAIGCAILGALLGGTIIYWLAGMYSRPMMGFIAHIPGINEVLIKKVQFQMETRGLLALLLGPLQGIPYKIYAAQWGIADENMVWFWLVSVPARGIRFVVTAALTRLIWIFAENHLKFWNRIDGTLLIVFWIGFYIFYFSHFGW